MNKKQKRQEVIDNITNTIRIESKKVGGNKELIQKLQIKLDNLIQQ